MADAGSSTPNLDRPHDGWGPPWLGPTVSVARFDARWLFVASVMGLIAITLFGWRGGAQLVVTSGGTTLAWLLYGQLWSRADPRAMVRPAPLHVVTLGMFLGLGLPMMLDLWVPLILGLLLGLLVRVTGRGPRVRVNLVALLLVALAFLPPAVYHTELVTMREQLGRPTDAILRPNHLIVGDVSRAEPVAPLVSVRRWSDETGPIDAVRRRDTPLLLSLEQRRMLRDEHYLVNLMRNNELPRMYELYLGAVPGPIGATSPAVIVLLGLYLIHRQLASWRTAVTAFAAAVVTYGLLPIQLPPVAGEIGVTGAWSIGFEALWRMGPPAAITFIGYLLLLTPWCFVVLILAPMTDPMSRGGRWVYGLLLGVGLAVCQWWLPVPEGAYVALLAVSVLSRPLDAVHRSPFVR